MNTLITMTLTGSAMTITYLLARSILGRSLTYRNRYLWLNMALLSFIVPMQLLKYLYTEILSLFPVWSPEIARRTQQDQIIFTSDSGVTLSTAIHSEINLIVVWFAVAALVLIYKLSQYFHSRRLLLANHAADTSAVISPEKYAVKRRVKVFSGTPDSGSFSLGVRRPVIFLNPPECPESAEAVLHHELVHIRRLDTVWHMLDIIALCVQWYNPLVYYLVRERSKVCELSCDEIVTENMSADNRALYAMTVASHAATIGSKLAFAQHLTKDGENVKERLENILSRESVRNSTLSAICMAAAIFASSLTVFAYDDIEQFNSVSSLSIDENSEIIFVPEGEESIFGPPKIIYDQQFTDGDGNIYKASYQDDGVCSHVFVPGTAQTHTPDGDGCTVYSRFAQWCNLCSYTEATGEEYTSVFPSCIHDF